MKMIVLRIIRLALAALVFGPLVASVPLLAQAQAPGNPPPQMNQMPVDEDHARSMTAERQRMMANMHAQDQQLNELVAQMNSAAGAARVDAIATVVAALVEQRAAMRTGMMAMESEMMNHMMQHMMSMQGNMMGMMGRGQTGTAQSRMSCPMMQQMQKEATEPAK
jgi:cell division protein FtsL